MAGSLSVDLVGAPPRAGARGRLIRWALLRLGGVLFVLWAVATVTFFALRLIPGDPAEAILGGPGSQASAEALAQARADYGLDQPLVTQYLVYLGHLAVGDLGDSYALRESVASVIVTAVWPTLLLAVLSLVVAQRIRRTEVTGRQSTQVREVLHGERRIQPVLRPRGGESLRTRLGPGPAEDRLGRVARDQLQGEEGDGGHRPEHEQHTAGPQQRPADQPSAGSAARRGADEVDAQRSSHVS